MTSAPTQGQRSAPKVRFGWVAGAWIVAGLAAALALRSHLLEERRELRLAPPPAAGDVSTVRRALGERRLVLLSAGLGVFRPLAIDFLWLRAAHVQRKGESFEAAALARLITALEPRLEAVWSFQARSLAYDIPPSFPPRERPPWVRQALRLLRDDGLLNNPESAVLRLELAFILEHKVGLDFDEAGPLYRSELAAALDHPAGSAEEAEALRQWKLEKPLLDTLSARFGAPLDVRVAAVHALYWAESGLALQDVTRWHQRRLEDVRDGALWQLFDAGKVVRSAAGSRYAFLPDTRFLRAAGSTLERERQKLTAEELSSVEASLQATAVIAFYLEGNEAEARSRWESHRDLLRPEGGSLDDLLVRWVTRQGEVSIVEAIAICLDSENSLRSAGSPAADVLHRLAALLAARRDPTAAAESLEALSSAARARWESPVPPRDLPFHLEVLHPGYGQDAPAARTNGGRG